jgi:hypothetical protein
LAPFQLGKFAGIITAPTWSIDPGMYALEDHEAFAGIITTLAWIAGHNLCHGIYTFWGIGVGWILLFYSWF